ncbi:ATP-binding cassette, sub-B (MDR TAP), member 4 [Thoreauomyces humboldtii]|nr:ATP-binding cassette, sub-B (MDR TAP), member 4 [Thoreauomyces humboldtii]
MAGRVSPVVVDMPQDPADVQVSAQQAQSSKDASGRGPQKPKVSLLKLWRFADSKDFNMIMVASGATIGSGLVYPLAIAVFAQLITPGKKEADSSVVTLIGQTSGKMAILAAWAFVTTYLARSLWCLTAERQTKKISLLYLERLLNQDLAWFDTAKDKALTGRLTADIPFIKDGLGENMMQLGSAVAQFVCSLIIAFYHGWKISIIILALMPLLVGSGYLIVKCESVMVSRSGVAFGEATAVADSALSGIRTVFSFSLQERFTQKYDERLQQVRGLDVRKGVASGFASGLFQAIIFLIFAFGFWYAAKLVKEKSVTGGDAAIAVLAMMIVAMALMRVPAGLAVLATAQVSAATVYSTILSNEGTLTSVRVTTGTEMQKVSNVQGEIAFRGVDFSYPARPEIRILNGLTADIKAGQTVAFVGGSGSGKSTTIALLQRFYEPSAGSVFLDGIDIATMDPAVLRRHIGVVGQEPVLFAALTIRQNILMGLPDGAEISPARFVDVCKMAQCHDFVAKFPLGYDTTVSTGTLSGGQRQRIAIARSLIKNPSILLLDEATSALDTKSERLVQKALDEAAKGRTTIVIAHRLSTVRNADAICVVSRGQVVERGTHSELYDRKGIYTQLVDKQKISTKNQEQRERAPTVVKGSDEPELEAVLNEQVRAMMQEPSMKMDPPDMIAAQLRLRLKDERLRARNENATVSKWILWRVLKLMSPTGGSIFLGTLAAALGGLVLPGFAITLGLVLGKLTTASDDSALVMVMVLIALLALVTKWGSIAAFGKVDSYLTRRLRLATFKNLLRQEMGFFDAKSNAVGVLCYKLGAIANVPHLVTDVWGSVAELGLTAFVGVCASLAYSPTLVVILLIIAPFILFATYWQTTSATAYADASREAIEQATQVANEAIREVKTIKTLQREGFAVDRYDALLARPFMLTKKNAFVDSFAYAMQASAAMLTLAVGFYAGEKLYERGDLTLTDLFTTILGMMTTMISIASSAAATQGYAKGRFAAKTTFLMHDRKTAIDPDKKGQEPAAFSSGFNFKNLIFQYPTSSEPTFRGAFHLEGKENTSLALVGPSGCGKSTIIGLLQRWYDVSGGEATIGNVPIDGYNVTSLRSNMALVGQEPTLFDMSIAENIAWGSETPVTMDDIVAAAQQADAHTFITGLPQKYDTRVGAKGGHLSGGQKQRIAIARALIRKPKLLLLDEATSALDSTSELEVQKAIDQAAKGRTTVTIAHRLSTIKDVDYIAVVNEGRIIEYGTHKELMALRGFFADMCAQQEV